MKKLLVVLGAGLLLLTSCEDKKEVDNTDEVADTKEDVTTKPAELPESIKTVQGKIGYYVYDSLLLQCQLIIDAEKEAQDKVSMIEKKILGKQSKFQKWQQKWAEKAGPTGQLLSSEQEQMQREGQKWQQEMMQAEQNAQRDMAVIQEQNLALVQGRVSAFVQKYANENGYDMVIAKQSTDLNYFNPDFDITRAVIDGLNADYKK